ncbi:methyltransferase domain-containing protein [Pseudoduganella sp. FT25W]|uniref:Methyltransferase domain-containing protein n=1 Tax=Duganella alba TaxID=2666081 RepID=A0A6L5QDQ9_9BURK|nr:class I SAM-dependent methyltransferase [Duganella alba]MRX07760.1 methyltransferase domain-containing protein [Duganella alba]MRX15363.1 methyltransferase domain-containing protein [Duganella alba]
MDWTAGYVSDIEYTSGFYREQSPAWLNFVCLLNGVEPVALDQPFTYFELGFGRGLTAQLLAGANPMGQFYAADFNPAHVAGARALAREAQLPNLTLLENSFAELAEGQVTLPQFDYITLHGIYSWVTAENRRHIVNFIGRYLKPGGVVYISYNAMPGWAPALPLQRLLVEYADAFPNRSDVQLKGATEFIGQLEAAQAAYMAGNPSLKIRLDSLRTANPHYLVHEYLHKHWQPLFHADVARDLAAAKMSFAGSADLPFAFPTLYLSEERRQLVDKLPHPEMRETLKDYLLNTAFRKDVFVRGAQRIGTQRQSDLLGQVGLTLTVPRADVSLKLKLPMGEADARPDIYNVVLDALAQRPHTLAELARLPGQGVSSVIQIAALMSASSQTAFYFPANARAAGDAAARLNATLSAQTRYSDEHQALCSPLLGCGVSANYVERLFFAAMRQQPADLTPGQLARVAWDIMAPSGRRLQREGVTLEAAEDNLALLTQNAQTFLTITLPLWQSLRVA